MFRSYPGISDLADAHRSDLYAAAARERLLRAARGQRPPHPAAAAVRRAASGLDRIASLVRPGSHAAAKPGHAAGT